MKNMKRRRVVSSRFNNGSIGIHAEQPPWSESASRSTVASSHRTVSAEAFSVKWMCRVTLNLWWSAVFNFKTHSFKFHQAAHEGPGGGGSAPAGREERSSGRGSWPNLTDWGFSSSTLRLLITLVSVQRAVQLFPHHLCRDLADERLSS